MSADVVADSPAETVRRGCTPECWTEETCASCHRIKAPTGRDLPTAGAGGYCDRDCPGYGWPRRHLWDEHDSARYYTDRPGWEAHEAACEACRV